MTAGYRNKHWCARQLFQLSPVLLLLLSSCLFAVPSVSQSAQGSQNDAVYSGSGSGSGSGAESNDNAAAGANDSNDTSSTRQKTKRGPEALLSDSEIGSNLEPHPDPNEEHYEGMIYVGRHECGGHHSIEEHITPPAAAQQGDNDNNQITSKRRVGFDFDNGIKYIFGTSFDESHKDIEEEDLHHERYGADVLRDIADRGRGKTREEVLKERRHGKVDPKEGPKPFGHVDVHPLDGGVTPPKVVHVDPFFMDEAPVTNKEFGKFARATYYETEAEQFGWSFVLKSFLPKAEMLETADVDPEAEDWVAVDGAYWRAPEGPGTSYKYRENHPVVHVSHRDAAEYCTWKGKRLPGEREWEAAARAGHFGPSNRTLYSWGEEGTTEVAKTKANLWGDGAFPWENNAEDGWRGTSPVRTYPPNGFGFYDVTGNVWEWMRGGKHKARIVRGGSYVDSLDGSFNHAATLGSRSTLHGTTSTGNVGFRCVKSPRRRTEYHWVYHDEEQHGQLAVEDQYGKKDMIPQRGREDQFEVADDDEYDAGDEDEFEPVGEKIKKRKVVKPRTRRSNEL